MNTEKALLRFLTCGSVDDGKSTLIGRLLYDTASIYDDQLTRLTQDSKRIGTQRDGLDFALLVDGLEAEREQGITIDVAYRYFSTDTRKFIIADAPGHEQYTRNMATAASVCDVAVILIDARFGVQTQTRRHSFICALMGIQHVIVAVNKMDAVQFDQAVYKQIQQDYLALIGQLDIPDVRFVPMCALTGDNVVHPSEQMPWFRGQPLLHYLHGIDVQQARAGEHFRFPVQRVSRPSASFRGYQGRITSGSIQVGDSIRLMSTGAVSRITDIRLGEQSLSQAQAPQSVTLCIADALDVSRGDLLVDKQHLSQLSDRLRARVLWFAARPLEPGAQFTLQFLTKQTRARVERLHHQIDVNSFAEVPAVMLSCNDIGVVDLRCAESVAFDDYVSHRETGAFLLVDNTTGQTVAAGMVQRALPRAGSASTPAVAGQSDVEGNPNANIRWHVPSVTSHERAAVRGHRPCVVWFTGLSGSGKSTLAHALDRRLFDMGCQSFVLDGDNLRHGLNKDLGFTPESRSENVRRTAEVAKLLTDAGIIVNAAIISPFTEDRATVRAHLSEAVDFLEVFVDTPLEECERRDPKNLYKRARAGEIANFTGISSPYETPVAPDVHLYPAKDSIEDCVEQVFQALVNRGILTQT